MPEPLSDKSITREERIKLARARAAEGLPEVLDRREKEEKDAAERVRTRRPEEIRDQARKLRLDRTIPAIGPVKSPAEWAKARRACREYVIGAARSGRFVNYYELEVLTYEASQMKLGFRMIPRMCEEINEDSDGCLLSSWVVNQTTERPGEGFFELARRKGFDLPLETLQRQAKEHFDAMEHG